VLRESKDARGKVTTTFAGTLIVYQPKVFNPAPFHTGVPRTVQGRDAFQADVGEQMLGGWNTVAPVTIAGHDDDWTTSPGALAWQYAPDAWAVLIGNGIERVGGKTPFPGSDQVTVAQRFTAAGQPISAKVPFRPGYLPAGFTLQSITGQSMTAGQGRMVTVVYTMPQDWTAPVSRPRQLAQDGSVTSVVINILWVDVPPPDAVKRTGRCRAGQHTCMVTLPGGKFYVTVADPSKTLPDEELLKVADNLTYATITNPDIWYPVSP
jgi:hypothetical protein